MVVVTGGGPGWSRDGEVVTGGGPRRVLAEVVRGGCCSGDGGGGEVDGVVVVVMWVRRGHRGVPGWVTLRPVVVKE